MVERGIAGECIMGDDGKVCVVLCWIIAMPTWSIPSAAGKLTARVAHAFLREKA